MLRAWLPPASAVLRRITAPVRIDARVHIDARTSMVRQLQRNGADRTFGRQAAAVNDPVVARLASRVERIDSAWSPSRGPRHADETGAAPTVVRRAVPNAVAAVAPPALVLARATQPSPRAVTASATASAGWGDAPAPRPIANQPHAAAPDDRLPHVDVNHLTNRVIAAIEHRMVATRERLRE